MFQGIIDTELRHSLRASYDRLPGFPRNKVLRVMRDLSSSAAYSLIQVLNLNPRPEFQSKLRTHDFYAQCLGCEVYEGTLTNAWVEGLGFGVEGPFLRVLVLQAYPHRRDFSVHGSDIAILLTDPSSSRTRERFSWEWYGLRVRV